MAKSKRVKRIKRTDGLVKFKVKRAFSGMKRGVVYSNVERETAIKWQNKGRGEIVG